jgi:hypothetical protein
MFRLEIGRLAIHWDRDYGIDERTGWSFAWDGSFWVSDIEPSFFRFVWRIARSAFEK